MIANGGMDILGIVNVNHSGNGLNANAVKFINKNSDMTIGSDKTANNIASNADVNIDVTDGSLLNNGYNKVLISTTNGADLNINVTNGSIGEDLGNQDGNYTGIWQNHRDLTKSLNIAVDGKVNAISKGTNSSANIASLNKNLNVDRISSEGRTTVLVDSGVSGTEGYDILNASSDGKSPNIEGKGISIIASGKIGEAGNAVTFRQNGAANVFYGDDATKPHDPTTLKKDSTVLIFLLSKILT